MANRLICIVGPTSSGKTSLAMKLSKSLNIEVVSADSRQIYKEMNIGTGKFPSNTSKHKNNTNGSYNIEDTTIWGYDLASPSETFTAWEYADYARSKITEIAKRGKVPVLVGGTGFYIDVTTGRTKLESFIEDKEIKKRFSKMSLAKLQEEYEKIKSKEDKLDTKNPARLRRFLEKKHFKKDEAKILPDMNMEILKIGLTSNRETLYERADAWVENIWENGLTKETKYLVGKYGKDNRCLQGLIYKEVLEHLENKISSEEAMQLTKYSIHSYIRRQLTWFKKDEKVIWFDISRKDIESIVLKQIKEFLS